MNGDSRIFLPIGHKKTKYTCGLQNILRSLNESFLQCHMVFILFCRAKHYHHKQEFYVHLCIYVPLSFKVDISLNYLFMPTMDKRRSRKLNGNKIAVKMQKYETNISKLVSAAIGCCCQSQ